MFRFEDNWISLSDYLCALQLYTLQIRGREPASGDHRITLSSNTKRLIANGLECGGHSFLVRIEPIREEEYKLKPPDNWIDVLSAHSFVLCFEHP